MKCAKQFSFKFTLVLLQLFLTSRIFAWDSAIYCIHGAITDDAITMISKQDYPDIWNFRNEISNGSNTESHNENISDTSNSDNLNDGYPEAWWDKGLNFNNEPDNAVYYYGLNDFPKAYLYIGKICHLIQDMAVPAHAANIPHGLLFYVDNFESAANNNYFHYKIKPNKKGKNPSDYYYLIKNNAIKKIQKHKWVHPVQTRDYWLLDGMNNKLNGYGEYGGTVGADIFDYSNQNGPFILKSQIKNAISHTAGALIRTSELLPPIAGDLKIEELKDKSSGLTDRVIFKISFKVLENRKSKIKIFIIIDSINENHIKCTDYSHRRKYVLKNGMDLPWEDTFVFYWEGKLSKGKVILPGEHWLFIKVKDEDGNLSDGIGQKFVYEAPEANQ